MNEGITSITLPCHFNPYDSLGIEYVKPTSEGKANDFLSVDVISDLKCVETLIIVRENAVKLRDFLNDNLG